MMNKNVYNSVVSHFFPITFCYARRMLLCIHNIPLSGRLSRANIGLFRFARILNEFRWNLAAVITTINRRTGYILGEIAPGTRQNDTTENSNRRQTGAVQLIW